MNFTQIKETCLYIEDIQRTASFYQGLLELPVISTVEGRHIFFRCGTSVLLCFLNKATMSEQNLPSHFAVGRQHIAFEVEPEDYGKWKGLVSEKGIQITHEEQWPGGFESFYFEDPDGHVLEIVPKGMWG